MRKKCENKLETSIIWLHVHLEIDVKDNNDLKEGKAKRIQGRIHDQEHQLYVYHKDTKTINEERIFYKWLLLCSQRQEWHGKKDKIRLQCLSSTTGRN